MSFLSAHILLKKPCHFQSYFTIVIDQMIKYQISVSDGSKNVQTRRLTSEISTLGL